MGTNGDDVQQAVQPPQGTSAGVPSRSAATMPASQGAKSPAGSSSSVAVSIDADDRRRWCTRGPAPGQRGLVLRPAPARSPAGGQAATADSGGVVEPPRPGPFE